MHEYYIDERYNGPLLAVCRPFLNGLSAAWTAHAVGGDMHPLDAWVTEKHGAVESDRVLAFARHRGPGRMHGVVVDLEALDLLVTWFGAPSLEVGVIESEGVRGLAFSDGPRIAFVGPAEFSRADPADERSVPAPREWEHHRSIQETMPTFGPLARLAWFDGEGNGPSGVEVGLVGLDIMKISRERLPISRSVSLRIHGTCLEGAGSMGLAELKALKAQVDSAVAWVEAGPREEAE